MSVWRREWVAAGFVGLVSCVSVFIASCSAAREAIGIGSESLTVGNVVNVDTSGQEVSGDWTPADAGGNANDTLCLGYNFNQWAWSSDRGATWNTCNANSASCNGGFGQFNVADAGALATLSLAGDPTIVADKLGHVVWVALAAPPNDSCAGIPAAAKVVAVVSSDGGRTFDWSSMVLVNDTACSNGCQDQPDATFDYSTFPPTLLIAFRHDGVGPPYGTFGACTRRFFIDNTNHLQPMDDAKSASVTPSVSNWGIGAVRVRSGGGVMTLVYSTTDSVPTCPTTSTTSEGVAAVSSFDWGNTWTTNDVIFNGQNYSGCVLSGQVSIGINPRNYDYVRSSDGTNYVITKTRDPPCACS